MKPVVGFINYVTDVQYVANSGAKEFKSVNPLHCLVINDQRPLTYKDLLTPQLSINYYQSVNYYYFFCFSYV